MIGATTSEEYVKLIEKEKAIERRFMMIKLDEVSVFDTKEILDKLKKEYATFHKIKITKENTDYIVDLLDKHVKEKHFPDKAIDLLDYSCVIGKKNNHNELETSDIKQGIMELFKVDINSRNITRLKESLKNKIFAQNDAIEKVCDHLKLVNMGLKDKNKPLGVFLFLGESGVGKTELAKEIARSYFAKEDSYIKLDMEGFSELGSVSKILGANPGYVGHDDETFLLNKIRMNPCSVVILDEIEKANKDVINLFLNVFDEGYLIDSKKRKIDFSNSIIIMTSNLGFNNKKDNVGFNKIEKNKEELDKIIKKFFKEEFLNRVDEVIYFNTLNKSDYQKIAREYLNQYLFEFDKEKIIENFDYKINGVRELKRKLKQEIIKEVRDNVEIKS